MVQAESAAGGSGRGAQPQRSQVWTLKEPPLLELWRTHFLPSWSGDATRPYCLQSRSLRDSAQHSEGLFSAFQLGNQILGASHRQHASRPLQARAISLATMAAVLMLRVLFFSIAFCVTHLKQPTICTDRTVIWFLHRGHGSLTLVLGKNYIHFLAVPSLSHVWLSLGVVEFCLMLPFFLLIASLDITYWSHVIAKLLWRLMEKASFTLSVFWC